MPNPDNGAALRFAALWSRIHKKLMAGVSNLTEKNKDKRAAMELLALRTLVSDFQDYHNKQQDAAARPSKSFVK
jgi:hypothetical protein